MKTLADISDVKFLIWW